MIFLLPEGPGLLPVLLAFTGLGGYVSFEGASRGSGHRGRVGARSSPRAALCLPVQCCWLAVRMRRPWGSLPIHGVAARRGLPAGTGEEGVIGHPAQH